MASDQTPNGFDALGERVPDRRRAAAMRHLREMAPSLDTETEFEVVGKTAAAIERDEPYNALRAARDALDLTGAYRLIAVLCATGGDTNE